MRMIIIWQVLFSIIVFDKIKLSNTTFLHDPKSRN